jgi:hypothetical protein
MTDVLTLLLLDMLWSHLVLSSNTKAAKLAKFYQTLTPAFIRVGSYGQPQILSSAWHDFLDNDLLDDKDAKAVFPQVNEVFSSLPQSK